ncbi:MAG: hypothetical protein GEU73_07405 [Chloroflexi bacterium]|nr:hypothetical protein [Chloroflexota bacterium]
MLECVGSTDQHSGVTRSLHGRPVSRRRHEQNRRTSSGGPDGQEASAQAGPPKLLDLRKTPARSGVAVGHLPDVPWVGRREAVAAQGQPPARGDAVRRRSGHGGLRTRDWGAPTSVGAPFLCGLYRTSCCITLHLRIHVAGIQDKQDTGVLVSNVPLLTLLTAFLKIGVRSWGGGTATIYVMHRELVDRGWITSEQFTVDFGLSRIIPGINLLAMAVMVGYRLNGVFGSFAGILGLMLPTSLITLVITLGFAGLTANPIGEATVRGAVPVTAALTFALAFDWTVLFPWRELRVVALMVLCALASFLLAAVLDVSVAFIIVGSAVAGAFLLRPSKREKDP